MIKKQFKQNILKLICSITLTINSSCYMNTFYDASGRKLENITFNEPYFNNYRVLLEINKQKPIKPFFNEKFTSNLENIELSVDKGTLYIYPEYELNTTYDIKKTMEGDFSANKGGLATVIGSLIEILFNGFLISFFGSKLQEDSNKKQDLNYIYLSLFSLGIFNIVFDIISYKVKEHMLTPDTKKMQETFSIYANECDNDYYNHNKIFSYINALNIEKYSPEKNKIPLINSILKFSSKKDNTKSVTIKTDELGNFIINKDKSTLISYNCLDLTEIKSDIKEKKAIKFISPYIKK